MNIRDLNREIELVKPRKHEGEMYGYPWCILKGLANLTFVHEMDDSIPILLPDDTLFTQTFLHLKELKGEY